MSGSRIASLLAGLASILLLAGCAVTRQEPLAFKTTALQSPARIGVAMTPLPAVDTWFPGASCLLCLAAASASNSSLTDHARTLPRDDLSGLKVELAQRLAAKGINAQVIETDLDVKALPDASTKGPNLADKDFKALQDKYGVDKIVVISLSNIGFERTYSAYFPTAEPKGAIQGVAYMVDLGSNAYDWYQPLSVRKAAEGQWDEAPKFPGLTNAYFQAIELSKDEVLRPFSQ